MRDMPLAGIEAEMPTRQRTFGKAAISTGISGIATSGEADRDGEESSTRYFIPQCNEDGGILTTDNRDELEHTHVHKPEDVKTSHRRWQIGSCCTSLSSISSQVRGSPVISEDAYW